MLGAGAGVILAGAVVGGVVSCSNGNTTTSNTNSNTTDSNSSRPTPTTTSNTNSNTTDSNSSRPTPTTTSDYTLTPTAQEGITYNESLQPKSATLMTIPTSIAYASTQTLQQQQGLDVYVGGILASVITSKNTTINLTLNLSDKGTELTGAGFMKMGSLLAIQPNATKYQLNLGNNVVLPANTPLTLTPLSEGILQQGLTSPFGVQFSVPGNNLYDIDFPTNKDGQINFTTTEATITVNGVNIDLHVNLSPFNYDKNEVKTLDLSNYLAQNITMMDKYLTSGEYNTPFTFTLSATNGTTYYAPNSIDSQFSWNGKWEHKIDVINLPTVSIPLTFTNGKWEAPTIYAYYIPNNGAWQLQQYQYTFNTTGLPTQQ